MNIKTLFPVLGISGGIGLGLFSQDFITGMIDRAGFGSFAGKASSLSLLGLGLFLIMQDNNLYSQAGLGLSGYAIIVLAFDVAEDTRILGYEGQDEDDIILIEENSVMKRLTNPEEV